MARTSKVVEEALSNARKIEQHKIVDEQELVAEDKQVRTLAQRLWSYLSPQWYLESRTRKKK